VDKRFFFEQNLLALSERSPGLCARLSGAETTLNRYRFLDSRSGELIPALLDAAGTAHPLHSLVDPRREAERLMSTLKDEGFIIFLGLGGAFAIEAALERKDVSLVLAIDFDINGAAELLSSREYIRVLGDPRFCLFIDPSPAEIESFILEHYQPVLSGGIRTIPLRSRTELEIRHFSAAAETIQKTIEKVSADYSVQAYFGGRWFSNIIRNLKAAEKLDRPARPIREAAICAAGPSLDAQVSILSAEKSQKKELYIIAADTSLPVLLAAGLKPDAVVSIDCQHISYYHFLGGIPRDIPLFLDMASPPLLAGLSDFPFFFSGGHPLARYISRNWRPIPSLDTSGGNVAYACLSLAESLGAHNIHLYGADFSYPLGRTYARGAYIFPFFEKKQNRTSPLESLFSAFLYRSPFLPPEEHAEKKAYYETATLRLYRQRLEEKAASMSARVLPVPGMGAPIQIRESPKQPADSRIVKLFAPGKARMRADAFLEQYRNDIAALKPPLLIGGYLQSLSPGDRQIFITLLPQAAAVKRRQPELGAAEIIEAVKKSCVEQIERIISL
jgi:hypothetical protein